MKMLKSNGPNMETCEIADVIFLHILETVSDPISVFCLLSNYL